ncbi:hypothetical protein BDW42DRAFT_191133 [Aspergillus taichungensis]|uniref:Uncharacterized protein n=1 Tax=Aspergillus taichungensis TaxID=482145 RepID=A0A2J5I528_9EURO|nr:hypothetical protein BDW42DRAFT_191133 [Aspergillus taichungensis]
MPRLRLVRGLAAGVGLASESITAYRAKDRSERSLPQESEDRDVQQSQTDEFHSDEEWELDEAQDELLPPRRDAIPHPAPTTNNIDQLVTWFSHAYPLPLFPSSMRLPCPVILPQRRPGNRQRGFVKAYAPILEDVGISQAMFLDFLETANRAGTASPWLNAINFAAFAGMAFPMGIGMAVAVAIQKATKALIEVEGRRKSNTFFDKINDQVFRPRGLYCLVMTYNPDSSSASVTVDLDTAATISTAVTSQETVGLLQKYKQRFKPSDGKACEIPECAPLIFPGLDELQREDSNFAHAQPQGRKEFIANYLDKRAQAAFAMDNPDSTLSQGPPPTFTSRYADPSHPASSGSLISLVTGGHITDDDIRRGGRGRRLLEDRRRQQTGRLGLLPRREDRGGVAPVGGILTGVRKVLQTGVLYLMVVNMPSGEEMAAAREMAGS